MSAISGWFFRRARTAPPKWVSPWTAVLAALAIRLLVALLLPAPELGGNAVDVYLPSAHHIASGLGFNDIATTEYSMVGPGYPYFLAAVFKLFGTNLLIVRLIQCLLDSATVGLVYLIARAIGSRRMAFMAALAYAVYPIAIRYCVEITAETPFTLLQTGAIAALVYGVADWRLRLFLGSGILWALAILTRSTPVLLPFVAAPVVVIVGRFRPRAWIAGAVVAVATVVLLAAWGIRNEKVLHEFMVVQSNSGTTFAYGADAAWWTLAGHPARYQYVEELIRRGAIPAIASSQSDIDRRFWLAGIERYKSRWAENKIGSVTFFVRKFFRLWYGSESGQSLRALAIMQLPLLGLWVLGVVLRWRQRTYVDVILLGVIGYYISLHVLMLPMLRYLFPAMPLIMIYATFGVWRLASSAASRADTLSVP